MQHGAVLGLNDAFSGLEPYIIPGLHQVREGKLSMRGHITPVRLLSSSKLHDQMM